jgi:hypothetical protein
MCKAKGENAHDVRATAMTWPAWKRLRLQKLNTSRPGPGERHGVFKVYQPPASCITELAKRGCRAFHGAERCAENVQVCRRAVVRFQGNHLAGPGRHRIRCGTGQAAPVFIITVLVTMTRECVRTSEHRTWSSHLRFRAPSRLPANEAVASTTS